MTERKKMAEPPYGLRPLRILIVEDDDSIRSMLRDLLQMCNHQIYASADGENALKCLQSDSFDLLITDLGLPGMSGGELAGASRRYQTNLKILAITSWRGKEQEELTQAAGIDHVIWKPFRFEEIMSALVEMFTPTLNPTVD